MKKCIVFLLLLFSFLPTAQAGESGACKTIRVSGNAEYPPLTWQDKNNPRKITGFAIELLERAFRDLGIKIDAVYVGPWKRAQKAIENGHIDVLGGAYITEKRKTFMDYVSPPFVMDPTVIFVRSDSSFKFDKWDDLIGLTGGAPTGNSYGEAFDRFAGKHLTIWRVTRISQAFKKLIRYRNDYVVYGLYPGLAELERLNLGDKVIFLPKSVIEEGLYFTFSRRSVCNSSRIKTHLSGKIEAFTRQKLPQALIKKYLAIWRQQSGP